MKKSSSSEIAIGLSDLYLYSGSGGTTATVLTVSVGRREVTLSAELPFLPVRSAEYGFVDCVSASDISCYLGTLVTRKVPYLTYPVLQVR
jgi:hypothetical protein